MLLLLQMKGLVAPVVKSANPPHPQDPVAIRRMHMLLQQLRRSRRRVQQLQQLGHEDTIRFIIEVPQHQGDQSSMRDEEEQAPLQFTYTLGDVRRLLGAGGGLALIPGIRFGEYLKSCCASP